MEKRLFPLIILSLLMVSCQPYIEVGQERHDSNTLRIDNQTVIGQTFTAQFDGLQGMEVYLSPEVSGEGQIVFELYNASRDELLARTYFSVPNVNDPAWYQFNFSSISDSNLSDYHFQLSISGEGAVVAGTGLGTDYRNGSAYSNGKPLENTQLSFRPTYRLRWLVAGLLSQFSSWFIWILYSILLFMVPGWALLSRWGQWQKLDFLQKGAISAGVSLAIYPLLMLWVGSAGLKPGSLFAWIPVLIGVSSLVLQVVIANRSGRGEKRRYKVDLRSVKGIDWILVIIIVFLGFSRFWPTRNLVNPLGPDPIQHLTIVQLMIDNGGLFDSWLPYFPYQSFSVHYGFHSAVAVFSWLSSIDVIQSTIIVGQVINFLSILVLYPLAMSLSRGNKWVGIAVLMIAGFLSPMPSFYINWGRYPQLAGQVILPVTIWLFLSLLDKEKINLLQGCLFACLLAGLALTYYRLPFFLAVFVCIWLLGLLRKPGAENRWGIMIANLATSLAIALAMISPMIKRLTGTSIFGGVKTGIETGATINKILADYSVWQNYQMYFPYFMIALFVIALITVIVKRNWDHTTFFLWILGLSLISASRLIHMPFANYFQSADIIISLYIPVSILCAWFIGQLIAQVIVNGNPMLVRALYILVFCLGLWGSLYQSQIADVDNNQYVTAPDLRAMQWIKQNIPEDAVFLVQARVFKEISIFGADAGWYLPFYTGRSNTMPPQYALVLETPYQTGYSQDLIALVSELEQVPLSIPESVPILCSRGITHIYLGQSLFGGSADWIQSFYSVEEVSANPAYELIYHESNVHIFKLREGLCNP